MSTVDEVAVTKMSTRGQIVIPEVIRKKLRLKPGDVFVVALRGLVISLQKIDPKRFTE